MNTASKSLNQRIEFISSLMEEKQISTQGTNNDLRNEINNDLWIDRLSDSYQKSKLIEMTKIVLIYLGILARYPSKEEIQDFQFSILRKSISAVLHEITKKDEFQYLLTSDKSFFLKRSDPSTLYIDVTHTMGYPANTGIQRVVRSLCTSCKKNDFKIQLFKVDNRPILLSREEEENFYSWNKFLKTESPVLSELPDRILFHGRKLINIIKNFVRAIESEYTAIRLYRWKIQKNLRSTNKSSSKQIQEVAVFIDTNQQILLPELCFESSRTEFYRGLGFALPQVFINVIIYDLIPVYFPQYVVAALIPSFIEYLSILHYAKRVSCISKHVQDELTSFLAPFENKPLIHHHLLGCEEELPKAKTEEPLTTVKKILCVSTIEPRKNQTGILRAAQILWKEGYEFELQFVGAMGWKNETFIKELEEVKINYPVTYFKHVKEELLKKLYEEAYFTVFVSFVEGFGLPILESLRHGKPCISSNNSSMKEIVQKTGACITVDPNSTLQIAEAMKELLSDEPKYQELKKQAEALQWHTWDAYAKSIYDFCTSEPESENSKTSNV